MSASAKQTNSGGSGGGPQKMCKSPGAGGGKAPPLKCGPKTSDYEVVSTNCTLIGSNNLNLEAKLGAVYHPTPKINICSKPMKKSSPRHSAGNFSPQQQQQQHQQQQQQTKLINYDTRTILAAKSNFNSPISSPLNNGYSHPSPSYPNSAVSPYNVQISSPANSVSSMTGIKSPVAATTSPQQMRPPTPQPQPILPQAFQQIPVMTSGANLVQIIHNAAPGGYQNHPVLAAARQTIIGPPNQNLQQQSPLIKIKPPQNILPKPPATSGAPPQPTKPPGGTRNIPQTSVVQNPQLPPNPAQIVLPNQTILPAAQPGTLLLNQMPLIVQQNSPHGGVQLILRPSTPNSSPQLTTKNLAPQNLILQQGGTAAPPQVILQHAGGQRGAMQQPQQLVRVLTANGMIQQLAPTYITMNNQLNLQQLTQQPPINQQPSTTTHQPNKILTQNGQHLIQNHHHHHPGLIGACLAQAPVVNQGAAGAGGVVAGGGTSMEQLPPPKRKPKKKKKIKEKLDLGSIMKLSGIGDDDDVMFESDNSESTNTDSNPIVTQSQPQKIIPSISRNDQNIMTSPAITSPHVVSSPLISSPLISSPLVTSPENDPKRLHINSSLSQNLTQNLSQNLSQTVLSDKQQSFTTTTQSQLSVQQSLSDINAINQNLTQIGLIQNSAAQNFLNTNNQLIQSQMGGTTTTTLINQDNNHHHQSLANFLTTLQNQNFSLVNNTNLGGIPKFPQTSQQNFPNLIGSSGENLKNNGSNFGPKNLMPHFNIPNIQVQNFPNQNLILNQAPNTIIAPNFPGNLTINNGILQNNLIQNATNLTLPNFLQTGLVQTNQEPFSGGNLQRTGGFKLALSEDGRLILQHDPNLNQDIQSQLLLQNIFGINLQGGNLVLTSVSQPAAHQAKPIQNESILTQKDPPILTQNLSQKKSTLDQTKTTNILQNVISSVKTTSDAQNMYETQKLSHSAQSAHLPPTAAHLPPNPLNTQQTHPQHLNTQTGAAVGGPAPYVVNLTPDQLETLKKNGQVSVNGQIIYMQRPQKLEEKPPKSKTTKKKFEPKKMDPPPLKIPQQQQQQQTNFEQKLNQTLINQLQSPVGRPPNNIESKPAPPTQAQILSQKPPNNNDDERPQPDMNVEQFLTNLNINTTNLSQLISQKLSQELPPNVDHKILNIQAGPNAGQLVAKIDISSGDRAVGAAHVEPNLSGGTPDAAALSQTFVPMTVKQENDATTYGGVAQNDTQNPVPALVLSSADAQNDKNTVYQRIQTIQLTPQKQQLLKSVQLQIQALTARLQQKDSKSEKIESNIPENDIQNALRHLYLEQQKILATGKLLPPITSLNCNMDTISTQSGPVVSSAAKSNGSYMTSMLQQPVVSSNQPQKIYYHNGNQIITLNSSSILPPTVTSSQPQPQLQPQQPTSTSSTAATQTQTQNKVKKATSAVAPPVNAAMSTAAGATYTSPVAKPPMATTSDKGCQMSPNQSTQISIKTEPSPTTTPVAPSLTSLLSPKPRPTKPTYSKAQLIEQQLQTDQNGANNPDINTPFASKADACKRLVRYHCYNQPVLSEKDLNKADEIFELTARHFIGKFQGMVNKYKYLLLKESMREVPTSELMMIDRMFLAEEQQSFLKLQSDIKLQNDLEEEGPTSSGHVTESVRSKQVENDDEDEDVDVKPDFQLPEDLMDDDFVSVKQERADFNIKCGLNYFADESCDSVYVPGDGEGGTAAPKTDKTKTNEGGSESYNTTKIIGNFEIEINNKGGNFRQKTTDEGSGGCFEKGDDYDEWLCIQRELGYVATDGNHQKASESSKDPKDPAGEEDGKGGPQQKRNAGDNRLETLKKFRVEKHNSKSKKSGGGSIIGEVKFEVRIEHKKVFAEQGSAPKGPQKRAHYEFQSQNETTTATKRQKSNEAAPPATAALQIKQEEHYLEEHFPELLEDDDEDATSADGLVDTSIDEQVQSAIDSILNLQQIASMTEQQKEQQQQPQQVTCRNINTLTNYPGPRGEAPLDGDAPNCLDDAVNSILS